MSNQRFPNRSPQASPTDKDIRNGKGHNIPDVLRTSPLAKFFFLKTVFGIFLVVLLCLGGLIAYQSMVKEADPDIQIATAMVTTTWAGADAETMESQVTDILEKQLKSLKGLKKIESSSFNDVSKIKVEFKANANVTESMELLRQKVDDAEPEINEKADKPKIDRLSLQDAPMLSIALYGKLDLAVLSRAAEDIQKRLKKVPGVREVNLAGQRREVVHVQLIPSRLSALGISPTTVSNRIQAGNPDMPSDGIDNREIEAGARLVGRFPTLYDLRNLPVARLGGTESRVVSLDEVAKVRRDLEREKTRAFISWRGSEFEPVVSMEVVKVPGSDTIKVVNNVIAELESIKQLPNIWPLGMDYRIPSRQDETIADNQNSLIGNVILAVVCVSIVLFVVLTWRSALIAGLSIPLTFLGAMFVLWIGGQTLNNTILYGMVLALGLLVDVFILMMEGMHNGLFVEGLTFDRAALLTVKNYGWAAFSRQMTTILAMAPLMLISDRVGKFVRLLPVTVIICLLLGYAIALLVEIPLSRFLLSNVKRGAKKTRIDELTKLASDRFYHWSLNFTVPSKKIARAWTLGTIVFIIYSLFAVFDFPVILFPDALVRNLSINVELPPTATLEKSQEVADDLGEILRDKDYFESVTKLVGQKSGLVQESGIVPTQDNHLLGFSAILTREKKHHRNSDKYLHDLRLELWETLHRYPGASLVMNVPRTGEGGDPIAVEIKGDDRWKLRQISGEVQLALRKIYGSQDVRDGLGGVRDHLKLTPRREAMAFYGISEDDLAMQVGYIMSDRHVGDFEPSPAENDLEIRLSTAWPSRGGAVGGPTRRDELKMIPLYSPEQGAIAASSVLDMEETVAPLSITHTDTERTVTIYAKAKGRTPGEILADLQQKLAEMKQSWPPGYDYKFVGEWSTQRETFGSAKLMFLVALFLVFLVVVRQFGLTAEPLMIMLAIPFAFIGTFGGFSLFSIPISFPAVMGMISLVGIVVNDAIAMVDTMNSHRERGMNVRQAAARGAAESMRPILTKNIIIIVALIPLAISDPVWFPLCIAIIFGLMASSAIALLVIPGLYLQFTPK